MTEHDALLAAVIAAPADDAPRGVLADWYDDHGQEARAAMIRRMLARPTGFVTVRPAPDRRRGWLICRHWVQFPRLGALCRGLARALPGCFDRAVIRRGFVEAIDMTGDDWAAHADALTAVHPVTKVYLSAWPGLRYDYQGGDVPRLAHLPGRSDKAVPIRATPTGLTVGRTAAGCLAAAWPAVEFRGPWSDDPGFGWHPQSARPIESDSAGGFLVPPEFYGLMSLLRDGTPLQLEARRLTTSIRVPDELLGGRP